MDVRKRKDYLSASQKQRLVNIMAQPEQKCLIIQKCTQSFTKMDCQAKWDMIALSLNATPDRRVKTGADWKRVSFNYPTDYLCKQSKEMHLYYKLIAYRHGVI